MTDEDHEDCTFRNFEEVLQETIDRDALLLDRPEYFGPDRPIDVCALALMGSTISCVYL